MAQIFIDIRSHEFISTTQIYTHAYQKMQKYEVEELDFRGDLGHPLNFPRINGHSEWLV